LQKVDFVIIVVVAEVVFVGVVTLRLWIGLEVGLGGVGVVGGFFRVRGLWVRLWCVLDGVFRGEGEWIGVGVGFRVGRGFLWACGLGV
jgi:hypothetical protein